MKHGAFLFTGIAFLMAIPAVILAASFAAMLNMGSEGIYIHIRGEKTFSLYETAEKDLDRAVEIAGRRAAIAAADYMLSYEECLNSSTYNNPPYGTGAEGAIKELLITGELTSLNHGTYSSMVTRGSTLEEWFPAFGNRSRALSYNVSMELDPEDIYITPLNELNDLGYNTSYYATLRINASIVNAWGAFSYNGSLPRNGNTTRLISGDGIGANIFDCPPVSW